MLVYPTSLVAYKTYATIDTTISPTNMIFHVLLASVKYPFAIHWRGGAGDLTYYCLIQKGSSRCIGKVHYFGLTPDLLLDSLDFQFDSKD